MMKQVILSHIFTVLWKWTCFVHYVFGNFFVFFLSKNRLFLLIEDVVLRILYEKKNVFLRNSSKICVILCHQKKCILVKKGEEKNKDWRILYDETFTFFCVFFWFRKSICWFLCVIVDQFRAFLGKTGVFGPLQCLTAMQYFWKSKILFKIIDIWKTCKVLWHPKNGTFWKSCKK